MIEVRPTALLRYHAHTRWIDIDLWSMTLSFNPMHTHTHKFFQRSVGSKDMSGNKRTDRRTDGQTDAVSKYYRSKFRQIFYKRCLRAWRQWKILCTFGFVDDVTFWHNGANGPKSSTRFSWVRQVAHRRQSLYLVDRWRCSWVTLFQSTNNILYFLSFNDSLSNSQLQRNVPPDPSIQ